MTDNNQRAFIKCTVCEVPELAVHFSSVTQFCDHLRKDHADKDIKPYHCSQCDYKCEYKYSVWTLELSPYVLEIPNDAYIALSQNPIGCSIFSQEYCKLIDWYWHIMTRQFWTIIMPFCIFLMTSNIRGHHFLLLLWMSPILSLSTEHGNYYHAFSMCVPVNGQQVICTLKKTS